MKIYLCGLTHNDLENTQELTSVYDCFDGLIFVDGGSNDGTKELLESRKKEGKIIYRNWTNDFDFQNNEILRQGPMKIGDWFFLRDGRERFNHDWVKNVKEYVREFKSNNIRSVFNYGKGFAFEYYDDMHFMGNPHWGMINCRDNKIDLMNHFSEKNKEHTWRLKDGEGNRPIWNFIDHFAKYYYVYARSNHLLMGRENDRDGFMRAESNRQRFRIYCATVLNLEFTLDSLKNFLSKGTWKNDPIFIEMFNQEEILKTFYRWHILKHPLEQIKTNSKTWGLQDENV